jgi:hypothetical protein
MIVIMDEISEELLKPIQTQRISEDPTSESYSPLQASFPLWEKKQKQKPFF